MRNNISTAVILLCAGIFIGCNAVVKTKDVKLAGFTGYSCVGPNNNAFVGFKNGTILKYDASLNTVLAEISRFKIAGAENLTVSKDGTRLAVGRSDGSLDLIDISKQKLVKNLKAPGFTILMGVFSPDSKQLAVYVNSSYDRTKKQWKRPEEGNLWIYSAVDGRLVSKEKTPVLSGRRYQCIDWQGDIIAMVSAYDEGGRGVLLWDTNQHTKLKTLLHPKFQCGPLSVALSPDATKVAVGYAPYDVAIWDTKTGRVIHSLVSQNNWVVCLDFSPDGKLLASGEGNSAVRVWDVEKGTQLFELSMGSQNYSNYTYSVNFDSSGRNLVCGSADNHIVLWKLSAESATK